MTDIFYFLYEQIAAHAYLAIILLLSMTGVGVPVPEDLVVMATGVLSERGQLAHPAAAWASAYAGVLISDCILFFLGEHFGKAVLHRRSVKRLLHPRRLLWAHRQVHAHGAWVIFTSRFIPGSRAPTLLIGGLMHLKRWKFLVADCSGLVFSVSIQFAIGWYFSKSISQLLSYRIEILLALAAFGVVVLAGYAVWRWRAHGPHGRNLDFRRRNPASNM